MKTPRTKGKLHFDHLLVEIYKKKQQDHQPDELDFYPLLNHLCKHYELSKDELLLCGYRKAYRQAIEGV